MNTFIVALAIDGGSPERPPELHLWAVRTTSQDIARQRVVDQITNVPITAVAVRCLNDFHHNALGMEDEFIKAI